MSSGMLNKPLLDSSMDRKSILLFVLLTIFLVMVGAPIHEAAFDANDTKPFPIDSDFLFMVLGSLLTMSLSVILLTVPCLVLALARYEIAILEPRCSAISFLGAFEHRRLLFSPPVGFISLRI